MKNIIIFSLLTCLSLPFAQANDSEDAEAIADANDAGVGQMLNEMKDAERKTEKKNRKKASRKMTQAEIIKECEKQMQAGKPQSLICKKYMRPAPDMEIDIETVLSEAMKSKQKSKVSADYCHKATDSQESFHRCMEDNPAVVSSSKKERKHEGSRGRSPAHIDNKHSLSAE